MNCKQKFGKRITSFSSDIERLSQLAYSEGSDLIHNKIVCAQFSTLRRFDVFVKRALQLEGITSLKVAIERTKAIKLTQENSFQYKKENNFYFEKKKKRILATPMRKRIKPIKKRRENRNKFTKFEKGKK